jgi:hypothetical protein
MAGVSGPMLRDHRGGVRFLGGLGAGELVGSLVVGLVLYLLGTMVAAITTESVRLGIVAALGVLLAAADVAGKTPQARRQVPQRLLRSGLSPAVLGVMYGFDLGLLVTTRKTASLGWFALAAVSLLRPAFAPVLAIVMTSTTILVITAWTFAAERKPGGRLHNAWWMGHRNWLIAIRALSAATILAVTVIVAASIQPSWTH